MTEQEAKKLIEEWRDGKAARDKEQRERIGDAQRELLGDLEIDFREFKQRREALPNLVIEGDLEPGEMSYRDYCIYRQAVSGRSVPEPGGMTLAEYRTSIGATEPDKTGQFTNQHGVAVDDSDLGF